MDGLDPAVLAPLLFVVFFPLLWCGICLLLGLVGGWTRLGGRYGSHRTPEGRAWRWGSGGVGWINYNNVLTLHFARDGVHLSVPWMFRPGHPALFLPWSELRNPRFEQMLWARRLRVDVGEPQVARLRLPWKPFEQDPAARPLLERTSGR